MREKKRDIGKALVLAVQHYCERQSLGMATIRICKPFILAPSGPRPAETGFIHRLQVYTLCALGNFSACTPQESLNPKLNSVPPLHLRLLFLRDT
jgi:hypothetical protein